MERLDELHADGSVERPHRRPIVILRTDRVSGGKDVARINAHAEPIRILNSINNRRQVLESAANA
jgi:hypothetical protein